MILDENLPPFDPQDLALGEAFEKLLSTHADLQEARSHVPHYTGQWSDRDYYAEEKLAYLNAVREFRGLCRGEVLEPYPTPPRAY